jgi:molybdate transport system regulatory protein
MKSPTLRLRVDFNAECSLGPGKIQLLEGIGRTGSLSQTARDLDMSYRRAWLLLESVNVSFDQRVVSSQVGGKAGGGAQLTAFGQQVIDAFRKLEAELQLLGAGRMRSIAIHIVEAAHVRGQSSTLTKRRKLARS